MCRPPRVDIVHPWIGTGFDRAEKVIAMLIRDRAPATAEIGVERAKIDILFVPIAARGIGLPNLDQRLGHRARVFVQNPAVQNDPLAHRIAAMVKILDQVMVQSAQIVVAKGRARDLGQALLHGQKRLLGRAWHAGLVAGVIGWRVQRAVTHVEFSGFHLVSSCAMAAKVSLAIFMAWLARGTPA